MLDLLIAEQEKGGILTSDMETINPTLGLEGSGFLGDRFCAHFFAEQKCQASRPLAKSPPHPSPMESTTAAQRCCGDLPMIPDVAPDVSSVMRGMTDWTPKKKLQGGPNTNGVMGLWDPYK